MKLTKKKVKHFEYEQEKFGTKVALYNILFEVASDILKDLGNKRIHTE